MMMCVVCAIDNFRNKKSDEVCSVLLLNIAEKVYDIMCDVQC